MKSPTTVILSPVTLGIARGPRRKKLKWSRRDAESSQLYNLRLDLNALREEIQRLQDLQQIVQMQKLNQRGVHDGFYIKTVIECNRVLKGGYIPQDTPTWAEAERFMTRTLDDNVSIGRFSGRGIILEQWSRFTKAFSGHVYQMVRADMVMSTDETAMVTIVTSIQHEVTRDTLAMMFPRALQSHPHLVARLLGHQLRFSSETTFTFDRRTHQVISINTQLDSLEAFARMLQNPEELDAFFRGSRISEEFCIGDVDNYPLVVEEVQDGPTEGAVYGPVPIPQVSPPEKMQLQHILAE